MIWFSCYLDVFYVFFYKGRFINEKVVLVKSPHDVSLCMGCFGRFDVHWKPATADRFGQGFAHVLFFLWWPVRGLNQNAQTSRTKHFESCESCDGCGYQPEGLDAVATESIKCLNY